MSYRFGVVMRGRRVPRSVPLLGAAAGILLGCIPAQAQPSDSPRKQARAARIAAGSIRLDGRLDDEAWQRTAAISDFIQAEPVEGAAPSDPMEVRFLYDDTALWIGVRMRGTPSGPVQAPMTRRDEGGQADYVQIELDTYLDRRTAYMFGVTAAGVRLDHFHASDDEGDSDSDYDPVWEARSAVYDGGWSAELWLPFAQLRFNDVDERIWGLNVKRWRPSLNEENYWVLVGRTERGWSSRFGELRGIEGVQPARRLELLPYVAGSSLMTAGRDPNNPFDDGVNLEQRVGGDMKLGIGTNLTLEATINPDFGQIEADPAEVNLTAIPTFFSERRPFFLEGNNLLQGPTGNFYYSRRIGSVPVGPPSGDFVDHPEAATILGAAKLTGRLPSGTSLGFLGAVTGEESARIFTGQQFSSTRVAPRAYWGVARVQQEFGQEGSTYGFMATALHRDVAAGDPLGLVMTRNAFTALADTELRFARNTYRAEFSAGMTYVHGEPEAIGRLQQANTHLFQRPDQPQVRFDPTRTSLGGVQIRAAFDKLSGRHWLWGGNVMIESPEFDPNDFGQLRYAGDVQPSWRLTYRETRPGKLFRSYSFGLNGNGVSYFDTALGARINSTQSADFTFHNFWSVSFDYGLNFRGQDAQLTRGGPSMGTPRGWNVSAQLRNSNASQLRWSARADRRENENGDRSYGFDASLSVRPSPSWQFSIQPDFSSEYFTRQYFTTRDGGRPTTFNRRYIFGAIDRATWTMEMRVSYIFKPDLTLDVYAEPFAASGRYDTFGELLAPRSRNLLFYGTDGTTITTNADGTRLVTDGASSFTLSNRDFNVQSLRSNVVLRWEWRPGSILYVVWQQNREHDDPLGMRATASDLLGSFSAPGDNVVALKTTLWLAR